MDAEKLDIDDLIKGAKPVVTISYEKESRQRWAERCEECPPIERLDAFTKKVSLSRAERSHISRCAKCKNTIATILAGRANP